MLNTAFKITASIALGAFLVGDAAAASSVADFYRDRRVALTVGFPPGGGSDITARIIARHMGKYIPGQPAVYVKNMPGAASRTAANYLYNVAPKDGTELGLFMGRIAIDAVVADPTVKYDPRRFNWIGSSSAENHACISYGKDARVKTLQDAQTTEMLLGAPNATPGLTMNAVLGTRFKLIRGYTGSAEVKAAMERREIEGMCGLPPDTLKAYYEDWMRDGTLNVLLQIGAKPSPDLPNVPLAIDHVKSEEKRQILTLVFGWLGVGLPVAAPPETPQDRVDALRAAFAATVKDAEFLSESEKLKKTVDPVTFAEIDAFMLEIYKAPQAVIDQASQLLK